MGKTTKNKPTDAHHQHQLLFTGGCSLHPMKGLYKGCSWSGLARSLSTKILYTCPLYSEVSTGQNDSYIDLHKKPGSLLGKRGFVDLSKAERIKTLNE